MNAGLEWTLSIGQLRGIVAKGRTNDVRKIGVTSGATNRATHEVYKEGLRAAMNKPDVSDPELAKLIDPLYRPNASVGSGSTAATVRQELATGQPVGDAFHSQKAINSIRSLERWLSKNPSAAPGDRAAAENIIKDMRPRFGRSVMMGREEFIRCLLSVVSDRAQTAYQDIIDEWQPEEPPVTELFAALGYQIVEDFRCADTDANLRTFH